jgi:hypothetical protein
VTTPEAPARRRPHAQFNAAGWIVQDHRAMNLLAGPGIAVRELTFASPHVNGQEQVVTDGGSRLSSLDRIEVAPKTDRTAARVRQSILKRAFEGRLVPQDPSAEQAGTKPGAGRVVRSTPRDSSGQPKGGSTE